jgi:hypothetical protein
MGKLLDIEWDQIMKDYECHHHLVSQLPIFFSVGLGLEVRALSL